MLAGLSSTIRIFAMSGQDSTRCGATNLRNKPVAIEVRLVDDGGHVSIQLEAILRADRLGRDNENGYVCSLREFLQRRHDVEAAHVGHQQVEQDEIRKFLPRCVDRFLTTVRLEHGAREPDKAKDRKS